MWEQDGALDEVQLDAVRDGDFGACDVLFRRHAPAARRAAGRWVRDAADCEDLVAEAFVRVLIAVRSGAGPRQELRPYLLTTMRHLAINWQRRHARVDLREEVPDRIVAGTGADELMVRRWQAGLAWAAFCSLPGRWRTVVWHTEVEGTPAAELAPLLGVSPNGVAVLAMRAREGLRRAYLQVQVPDGSRPECDEMRADMGAWVRDGLSPRRSARIAAHVGRCADCRAVAAALTETNQELRPVLARRHAGSVLVSLSAGMATGGGKVAAVVAAAVVAVAGGGVPIPPLTPVPAPVPEQVISAPAQPQPAAAGGRVYSVRPVAAPSPANPANPTERTGTAVDLHSAEGSEPNRAACSGRGCGNAKADKANSGGGNKWAGQPGPPGHSKSGTKSSTTPPGQQKKADRGKG
ncbi:sigma-70 family RNA polymerase sigma factor [Amycolatopsis magusensis]|uniref:sigma-70 family RNA polymerase sigma factor n=1 Tax=Amycolatopsis magusensis TaxID=882444 RepID=UPI003C2B54AF